LPDFCSYSRYSARFIFTTRERDETTQKFELSAGEGNWIRVFEEVRDKRDPLSDAEERVKAP
jgi:hypothetical protein